MQINVIITKRKNNPKNIYKGEKNKIKIKVGKRMRNNKIIAIINTRITVRIGITCNMIKGKRTKAISRNDKKKNLKINDEKMHKSEVTTKKISCIKKN